MKRLFSRTIALFTNRKIWVRQIVVASLAAGAAWLIGEQAFDGGGLVAAIVCSLSIRISLYKSVREGLGQILGTAIGAGIALTTVYFFDFGVIAVATTVLLCSVVARALHLGEVASVNVPVTALIVIGPGISSSTAEHRLYSTLIGAAVAIVFSYFSHASTVHLLHRLQPKETTVRTSWLQVPARAHLEFLQSKCVHAITIYQRHLANIHWLHLRPYCQANQRISFQAE